MVKVPWAALGTSRAASIPTPMRTRTLPVVLLLPCFAILSACATAPAPTADTTAATAEISAATRWFAVSAERDAAFHQAYDVAGRRVEILSEGRRSGTWAVVLDVDETVLDNVAYQIFLDRAGREFALDTWQDWVGRAEAPALPGAAAFARRVRELGGVVALVSNRRDEMREPTAANLRAVDVPWDLMLLRTDTGDKEPRWRAIEDGTASPDHPPLEIVLWVGDNILDFPGMTQAVREEDPEAFAPFGDRFIVVPNPGYGSWQENPVPEGFVPARSTRASTRAN